MFNEHYLCKTDSVSDVVAQTESFTKPTAKPETAPVKQESVFTSDDSDIDLDELLKDL